MKIRAGIWRLKNGREVEVKVGGEGYYSLVWNDALDEIHSYNEAGECYRAIVTRIDSRVDSFFDHVKVGHEMKRDESERLMEVLRYWDLDCFLGYDSEDSQKEVIKRNSNPILSLDLCTE